MYTLAIITSSDKGYLGERFDESGEIIKKIAIKNGFVIEKYIVLPDDLKMLENEMENMCDTLKVNLILTTGGTGFSHRDITPEATNNVIKRIVPGIPEAIRAFSMNITKRAMLSRAVCGIRHETIILNMPGSPKACSEVLEYIIDDLKHGIDILLGSDSECAR